MSKTIRANSIETELAEQRRKGMYPRAKSWSRKGDPKRVKRDRNAWKQTVRAFL